MKLASLWAMGLVCVFAPGQPVLLPVDGANASHRFSVRTFRGIVPATSAPARVSSDVTIVILLDNIAPDDLASAKASIAKLYPSQKGLTLALAGNAGVQRAGPFQNRLKLAAALKEIEIPEQSTQRLSPADFYTGLPDVLRSVCDAWSPTIVAGRFPVIPDALADYSALYLSTRFRAQKCRFSYWPFGGDSSPALDKVAKLTSGVVVTSSLEASAGTLADASGSYEEISWEEPAVPRGFFIYEATLIEDDKPALTLPRAALASGSALPPIGQWAALREHANTAAALVKNEKLDQAQANEIRQHLEAALAINPRDGPSLRTGADFYKRAQDHKTAASLLGMLTEIEPDSGSLHTELGHELFAAKSFDAAEKSLLRGRELKAGSALLAEELAHIHLTRRDDSGAMLWLDESLAADGRNQPLWFLRGEVCARLKDWPRQAESLEHVLALGGEHLNERMTLVRGYLDHREWERATAHVDRSLTSLPPDANLHATWAGYLEELRRPKDALEIWKRAITLDPKREDAHYAVTRLLLDAGELGPALEAAERGISATPQSARLYLAKASALERQGRDYAARRTLQSASSSSSDLALLQRAAEVEDLFGKGAPAAYQKWCEAMEKADPKPAGFDAAIERGLLVSEREGDLERIRWFAGRSKSAGHDRAAAVQKKPDGVWVPGGLDAMAFLVHGKTGSSPERFFTEYARGVVSLQFKSSNDSQLLNKAIKDDFQRLGSLLAMAPRRDNKTVITLSIADKKLRQQTERVLNLLGWKMRLGKDDVTVESGEKASQAKKQDLASALAIDQVGMQDTFGEGKPFRIEIPWEWAPIALDEAQWRNQFWPKENLAGSLCEAMVREPKLAQLYLGLAVLDRQTASAIVSAVGLKALFEKYAARLSYFGSALAITDGRAVVPGGTKAEPLWAKLAGAEPASPSFFRELISKDEGKLLAYFHALSQLDFAHQRFYTVSGGRLGKFYELFRDSPEYARGVDTEKRDNPFAAFLREVPLDSDGAVIFPGSPEVWMVAKGQTKSAAGSRKLLKKMRKKAAPDVEDEILIRLARTKYKSTNDEQRTELDNFIAVTRIEEHRNEPLDEASALALAQHYAECGTLYPYFAELTGLGGKEFEAFFAFTESMRVLGPTERDAILGPFESLLELLRLGVRAGALGEQTATEVFGRLCVRFASIKGPADRFTASLEIARDLAAHSPEPPSASLDLRLRGLILGQIPAGELEWKGRLYTLDAGKVRGAEFDRVLAQQKAPSMDVLARLDDARARIRSVTGNFAEPLALLETEAAKLPAVEPPKNFKATHITTENLKLARPERVRTAVARLRQKTAKKKINPKDLEKSCAELLDELAPQMRLALAGLVYAFYTGPDDLMISEDPLLLRKHDFAEQGTSGMKPPLFLTAREREPSAETGASFAGDFANFALAASGAASHGKEKSAANSMAIFAEQIGSVRASHWNRLRDDDLRLMSLKIRMGREWCVEAARRPERLSELAEETLGRLSSRRRHDLLTGIARGDWGSVWQSVSLSDLYFLGDRWLVRYGDSEWVSPVAADLRKRAAKNDGARLNALGPLLPQLYGCTHPHLVDLPPYEEYERQMFPTRIAERAAEFKIYLAEFLDRLALPASTAATVAEPLARKLLANTNMADAKDWVSVLSAWSALDENMLEGVLPQ